jgi:chemotaxis protein methyltransferase CheR
MSPITHCIAGSAICFFEEADHFRFLAETVASDLKAGAAIGRARQARIWSAVCSKGEEPYSIAISLRKALEDASATDGSQEGWHIEVLASDSDPALLAAGAERTYHEDSLRETPAEVKQRFFLRGRGNMTGCVRVKQSLAELVHFQQIHLQDSDWPVDGPFDVIFFRNALARFSRPVQERILREMCRYLAPHGYLILGSAESVPWLHDAVKALGKGIHQLRPRRSGSHGGRERRSRPREGRPFE